MPTLTIIESEALALIRDGYDNGQVAKRLGFSGNEFEALLRRLVNKLRAAAS
jgi:DNA-binding CsgD family transcriptional regulator